MFKFNDSRSNQDKNTSNKCLLIVRVRGRGPERFIEVPGRVDGTGRRCDRSVRVQTVALSVLTDAACMPDLAVEESADPLGSCKRVRCNLDPRLSPTWDQIDHTRDPPPIPDSIETTLPSNSSAGKRCPQGVGQKLLLSRPC